MKRIGTFTDSSAGNFSTWWSLTSATGAVPARLVHGGRSSIISSPAIQLGLTATPKETTEVSTLSYFGDPIYTYSLKQGIDDGFLAPFKVVRIDLDKDLQGWRPPAGMTDDLGQEIEDRVYNQSDMDRVLVLNERTRRVAEKIVAYMLETDPYGKTIVFCENIDHAERMRSALVNEIAKCLPQEAGNASKFVVSHH